MNKCILIFVGLAALVSMINAQCGVIENNIDYNGNDITFVFTASITDCCTQCSARTDCRAITYVAVTQLCWLKSVAGGNRIESTGRQSSIINGVVNPIVPIVNTPQPVITIAPIVNPIVNPVTQTAYGCYVENGINYPGFDMASSTVVASPSECCNLCGRTPTCLVWSYLTTANFCFLKNQVPSLANRTNYSSIISGVVTLR